MDLLPAVPADIPGQFSWWQYDVRETLPASAFPPLSGLIDADVAIVGGGFTGLWTALTLKQRDPNLRVVVIDSFRCGDGASSRNGGNVHGYWGALPTLLPLFGADKSLEAARLGTLAQKRISTYATERGRDVWWVQEGYLRVATSSAHSKKLRSFVAVADELGVRSTVRSLSKSELQELCNSPRFVEGLHFEEGATVHPARLVHALRESVAAAGVQIFEHTPALRVKAGSPNYIETKSGGITSREVVLATYTGTMSIPSVAKATTLFSSFPVMSDAYPEILEKMNYLTARGMADLRMFTHYFRRTRDGRILMGSGSGPLEQGALHTSEKLRNDPASARRAELGLKRFFPGMEIGVAARWGFPIDVTSDRLPYFGTLPNTRIHYGSGYSGHGVNATVIAGECLSSLILGNKDQWSTSAFCSRQRVAFPPEPFRFVGGTLVRNAIVECEDAEDAGLPQPFMARAISELPRMMGLRIGTR